MVAGFAGSGMFQIAFAGGPKHVILVGSESYTASNEYLISSVVGHRLDLVLCRPDVPRTGRRLRQPLLPVRLHLRRRARGRLPARGARLAVSAPGNNRRQPSVAARRDRHRASNAPRSACARERGPILLSVMLATGAGRDRLHDPRHRGAVDRRRPRRLLPVPVAVLDLPAGAGGVGAGLRQVRRLVGRKPMMLFGIALFLVGSILCGFAWIMVVADRRSARCRAWAPARCSRWVRRSSATSTRSPSGRRSRLRRQRLGRLVGRRAHPRRRLLRLRVLALDLLRQHPASRIAAMLVLHRSFHESVERKRHRSTTPAPPCSPSGPRCSSSGCSRAARPGPGTPAPASPCCRSRVVLLLVVRVRRVARRRADPAAVGLPPPAADRRQRHVAVRRRRS